MSIDNFEILQELGKGSFGSVYKVKRITDNKIYAMKCVQISSLSHKEKQNALNEIRILASIDSNNVVSYKEAFYNDPNQSLYIIMDYLNDGDLEQKVSMYKKFKSHFSEKEIWHIFNQIALGLKAMHDKNILHRDLKCSNIFITKKGLVKIGDMNVSKVYKEGLVNTQTGTPYYASPEVWKDLPYDYKSDLWSLGCIVYEMCTLRPPFSGKSLEEVYKKVTKANYLPIPIYYSSELNNVIYGLLSVNPNQRPSLNSIIQTIRNMKLQGQINYESDLYEIKTSSNNDNIMLQTLKVPLLLKDINKMLPKSKYTPTNRVIQSAFHSNVYTNTNTNINVNVSNKKMKRDMSNKNINTNTNPNIITLNQHNSMMPIIQNTTTSLINSKRKKLAPLNMPRVKERSPQDKTPILPEIIPNKHNPNGIKNKFSRNNKLIKLNRNYSSNLKLLPTSSSNNISTLSNKSNNSNSGSAFDFQFGEAEPVQSIIKLREKYLHRVSSGKIHLITTNNNTNISNLQISTEGNDVSLPKVVPNRQLPKITAAKKGKKNEINSLIGNIPFYPFDYKQRSIIPEYTNDNCCIK